MSEEQSEISSHLHPNWRALATVKFRRKVFIKSNENEIEENHETSSQNSLEIQESASNFYQEVLQMPSTSIQTSSKVIKKLPKKRKVEKEKTQFSKETLFRLAVGDDGEAIRKYIDESIDHNINAVDNFGWTALMMAACEGSSESFQVLLNLGADLSVSDRKGNTARTLAYKNKREEILCLIDAYNNQQNETIEVSDDEEEAQQEFFCPDCKVSTSSKSHHTSTVHLINCKFRGQDFKSFGIGRSNKGYEMMKTLGWDEKSALGSKKDGKLYPIKTVLRKGRAGLGIAQNSARVTHFKPYDVQAVRHRSPPRALTRKEIEKNAMKDKKREQMLRRELS